MYSFKTEDANFSLSQLVYTLGGPAALSHPSIVIPFLASLVSVGLSRRLWPVSLCGNNERTEMFHQHYRFGLMSNFISVIGLV